MVFTQRVHCTESAAEGLTTMICMQSYFDPIGCDQSPFVTLLRLILAESMAALLQLAKYRSFLDYQAPEDQRMAPAWPTDFVKERGTYVPSTRHRRCIDAVRATHPVPANMSFDVRADFMAVGGTTTTNHYCKATGAGPLPLMGIVPDDSIPHHLRGQGAVFMKHELDLATELLAKTPEYRRARMETMLWRTPQLASQVMYAMDGIHAKRKRQAHDQDTARERRVRARLKAKIPTAIDEDGVLADFP